MLLLRGGRVLRTGPIDDVLDAAGLSETFGLGLALSGGPTAGSARGLGDDEGEQRVLAPPDLVVEHALQHARPPHVPL